MRQDASSIAIVVLLVALVGIALDLILIRIRRMKHDTPAGHLDHQKIAQRTSDSLAQTEEPSHSHRPAIVDQLDNIEKANKKQMQQLMAAMVESHNWQVLGEQFSRLCDRQVEHLRALAKRHSNPLGPEKALHHTLEAFSISCLILSLYDELVAESDIVKGMLDERFQSRRGATMSQFNQRIHLDCARILLLDLDYASPPRDKVMAQLDMAEEFCNAAYPPDGKQQSALQPLLSEIALRKERLTK